uniref:nuclear transport factor 2 family protein n=1 Tax=Daejeonella sp. TaxID=2805397 RepID=UPI00404AC056
MKELKFKSLEPFLTVCLIAMLTIGCESPPEKAIVSINPNYEIASPDYSNLAVKALTDLTNFQFDSWGSMLAEDVEFYFPDGDAGTRTKLSGKSNVLDWWKNWKETSGVQSMTYTDNVDVPIIAKETMTYSGLTGVMVISYFSNEIVYQEGSVKLRMNFAAHFNKDNLIDRYYTYYDRTGIVELMKKNILDSE